MDLVLFFPHVVANFELSIYEVYTDNKPHFFYYIILEGKF